jgi:hypothetical protein
MASGWLWAESGRWTFEPFLTHLPGEQLVPPERAYSEAYRGIEEIVFIDDYLGIVKFRGREYRVFYEMENQEGFNLALILTFRQGPSLVIRLVRENSRAYRFAYSLEPDFFDALDEAAAPALSEAPPAPETEAAEPSPQTGNRLFIPLPGAAPRTPPAQAAAETPAADPEAAPPAGEEEAEAPETAWLWTGALKRLDPLPDAAEEE